MDRLTRPVEDTGVFETVARRKIRRRVTRRVQLAALALTVVAGTAAGGYGLTRLFSAGRESAPGEGSTPATSVPPPEDTTAPVMAACDGSQVTGDLDGDGLMDTVSVWSPSETDCDAEDVGRRYLAQVEFGRGDDVGFAAEPQELPECQQPFVCRVLAALDVDGDGAAEVAIQTASGASTQWVGLYRLDPDWNLGDAALERLHVEPPGDPWHEEFGFPPGPALFPVGGSVTHLHSVACDEDAQGRPLIAATTVLLSDPEEELYDIHVTWFRVEAPALVVASSDDVGPAGPEAPEVASGHGLCGVEPTDVPSPTFTAPVPTPTIDPHAILCDISSIDADVDGDGAVDDVTVFSPARTCDSDEVGQSYWIRLAFGGEGRGELEPQFLEACQPPNRCRLIAAPDLKADGSAELAIQTVSGASVVWFTLYRFDSEAYHAGQPALVRLEVAPPGDPWHEEFGLAPGPAFFGLYGSVTHLHGIRCQPESGADWIVVTALRSETGPDTYDVHESQFSLEGSALMLTATADYPDTPVDQLEVVVPTSDLCGAPFTFEAP
jgi:hypothetical protein